MATIDPIQAGPLKITFPANLPRNEIDLICMLLAGRLKDLLKGRLFCAQLAINDLISECTGIDGLATLANGLKDLVNGINNFKDISGYNNILGAVNQAMNEVKDVFSLGGLCPAPVHPPHIPDILGMLNQNLFGQGLAILNALARVENPKMCFGMGPNGFGVNWSSIGGDLYNLKNLIDRFKRDPAGLNSTINFFEKNLEYQTARMNSEIDRLRKNLSDPLGINEQHRNVRTIKAANSVTGSYTVVDKNGVTHTNPLGMLIPADIQHVLNNTDPVSNQPVTYKTQPVLDYCGDIVGYKKVAFTGDPNYIGWDTNPNGPTDIVNSFNPTKNPTSTFADYDFTFVEENNTINVYNSSGVIVQEIDVNRGTHYRLGFKLITKLIKFYTSDYGTTYYDGMQISKNPTYGLGSGFPGLDVVSAGTYQPSFERGEVDWSILIENTTAPNLLRWRTDDNDFSGPIKIGGPTSIPPQNRTYDLSMAYRKSILNLEQKTHDIPGTSLDFGLITNPTKIVNNFNLPSTSNLDLGTLQSTIDFGTILNQSSISNDFNSNISLDLGLVNDYLQYPSTEAINYEEYATYRRYNITVNTMLDGGQVYAFTTPLIWGSTANTYKIYDDIEHLGPNKSAVPGAKIVKWIAKIPQTNNYFVQKYFFNDKSSLNFTEMNMYITDNVKTENETFQLGLVAWKLEKPLSLVNDTKLPYKDNYQYKLSLPLGKTLGVDDDNNLFDADETTVELVGENILRWNLTANREILSSSSAVNDHYVGADYSTLKENQSVCCFDIEFDPRDPGRTFTNTNPRINKIKYYGRGLNNTYIDVSINYIDNSGPKNVPIDTFNAFTLENGRSRAGVTGSSYGLGMILN
jgi:hypothetical protein